MRKVLARLCLLALGVLAGTGMVELSIRLVVDTYRCDDALGWTFPPGATRLKFSRSGEFKNWISFNTLGLRGEEIAQKKPTDVYRVVFLGDSFTAALQVSRDETFIRRVESQLSEEVVDGRRIEFVNAGVDGYGTYQQVRLYRERLAEFEADLVILVIYYATDLVDISPVSGNHKHYIAAQCGRPYVVLQDGMLQTLNGGRPLPPSIEGFFASKLGRLRLYSLVFGSPKTKGNPAFSGFDFYTRGERSAEVAKAWQVLLRLLADFQHDLREAGVPLAVMVAPTKWEVSGEIEEKVRSLRPGAVIDPGRVELELAEHLDANGIGNIQLTPQLTALYERDQQDFYFKRDSHWNATGHSAVADLLHEWMVGRCDELGLPLARCQDDE